MIVHFNFSLGEDNCVAEKVRKYFSIGCVIRMLLLIFFTAEVNNKAN